MKPIPIKEFSHYLVDVNGNVYNSINTMGNALSVPKILKSWPNKNTGYHQVVVQNKRKGIKPKALYVHRLVAECYIPNPINLPEVNHKNLIKTDNRVQNLEWVTKSENMKHSVKLHGTVGSKIISNKILLKNGIDFYIKTKNIKGVASLWKCGEGYCYTILKKCKVDTSSRFDTPTFVLDKLKDDILPYMYKRFKTGFKKELIKKYKSLYNVDLTHHKIILFKKIMLRNHVTNFI